jgi:integrase
MACTGPRRRRRAISESEIAAFWRAASAERKEFAAVLKLLLLLGQRLGEVRGMLREELSEDGATWTIPGARTKNRRTHVVPLPPLARQIIADAGGQGEHVFSTTGGRRPVAIGSKIKKRLDARMKASAPWREHDLRRTCATNMADIGVQPHIIEACLNHISGHKAGVAGIYNRSTYAAEKRDAFWRWARFVALVLNTDLHAAHEFFLAHGDRENEAARAAFVAAITEGGARWDDYLAVIETRTPRIYSDYLAKIATRNRGEVLGPRA